MAKLEIGVVNFKSKPKQTFFAPEWDYYLFESYIKNVDFKQLAKFILSKEKEVLNLPPTLKDGLPFDGHTGLGKNSTTAKYDNYNVFKWKNKNIELIKKTIFNFHNEILKYFNQPIPNKLYIKSWVNIMRKGQQIKPHLHGVSPNTYLGGHICIQCQNTLTKYINPINQINDPETYSSKNEVGKITLFQNNIPHYTSIHNSDKLRITMAFELKVNDPKNNNYIEIYG
jgi:hypothetical protein